MSTKNKGVRTSDGMRKREWPREDSCRSRLGEHFITVDRNNTGLLKLTQRM